MYSITISLILLSFCTINSLGTMLPLEVIEITQHHHPHQQQQQHSQLQMQQQHHHYHRHPTTKISSETTKTTIMTTAQVFNNTSTFSPESSSTSSISSISNRKSTSTNNNNSNSNALNSRWNNLMLKPNPYNNTNNNIKSINNDDASDISSSTITTTTNNNNNDANSISNSNSNDITTAKQHKSTSYYNHHSERRRSRQMLDILQPQGTRILYQVGESEKDLPICAPNAVCSKIDLYETPWIERQCRCPDNTIPSSNHIIIHHNTGKDRLPTYEQKFKIFSSPHKKITNFDAKRFESIHLRKLMHKFDAVFEEDLELDENDLHDSSNENSAIQHNSPYYNSHRNDYNLASNIQNEYRLKLHENSKLRHSGSGGHHRDFPKIGGCPSGLGIEDGHTIADKTRHYKLCNPVHKLPICRYFRDYTWTLSSSPELNVTEQIVHCRCPKNSIIYLTKREPLASGRPGYTYLFACSPQSRLRCQRKEPCKLFTVRKRQEFLDEVNTNPLCQCPKGHSCPRHHTESGVIAGKAFVEDNIQTYSGYCMAND